MKKAVLIIIDGGGVGYLPDANEYGDVGANTFGNIFKKVKKNNLLNLSKLGLMNLISKKNENAIGFFGKASEKSVGKDSTSGHWEIAGQVVKKPFPTYPNGFPKLIIDEFILKTGFDILWNKPASGTKIIERFGAEHLKSKKLIVYTSQDSVFQIAAHKNVVSVDELYKVCKIARSILKGKNEVARVIARPFDDKNGKFFRTEERKDFSVKPSENIVLHKLKQNKIRTLAIGKIKDIYAGAGITDYIPSHNNNEGLDILINLLQGKNQGLIMINLVDFDMLYGHRRDWRGFYSALEYFDEKLGIILKLLKLEDLLIITADHGNDPTFSGWNHTREYIPILGLIKNAKENVNLGIRESFCDIGATLADYFNIGDFSFGKSFLDLITD